MTAPAIVLVARSRVRQEVRRRRGRDEGRAHAHRVEEPQATARCNPARPVPSKEVAKEVICNSPLVAGQLGIFDCSGVSDGSAAAVIVRAEDAHKYTDKPLYVKALSFVAGPAAGPIDPTYDYTLVHRGRALGRGRLQAGRHRRTRAPSWRWPRCTTASRPPSSCSWRTSGSPSEASAGRRCSRARSTSTASSR